MKQVLVVDDDPTIRDVVGDVMKEEGFSVSFAASGRMAFQELEAGPPDLVILDVKLPDGDGDQILRAMQSSPDLRDIPVIMISTGEPNASDDSETVTYLVKPFDLEHLVRLVIDAIGAPHEPGSTPTRSRGHSAPGPTL